MVIVHKGSAIGCSTACKCTVRQLAVEQLLRTVDAQSRPANAGMRHALVVVQRHDERARARREDRFG